VHGFGLNGVIGKRGEPHAPLGSIRAAGTGTGNGLTVRGFMPGAHEFGGPGHALFTAAATSSQTPSFRASAAAPSVAPTE
jgi:hypothetical protein